jgi:[ribosomal protein S5]-alanine N-acetyltransferase
MEMFKMNEKDIYEVQTIETERLTLRKLSAQIMLGNKQSERVLEKLGMTEEGILRQDFCYKGEFIDLKNFSILKEEYECMRRGAII